MNGSSYSASDDRDRLRQSSALHQQQDQRALDAAMDHLDEQGVAPPYRVLDAGCGTGVVTRERFGQDEQFAVTAFDRDHEALSIARNENSSPNIRYRRIDVLDERSFDESFDLVFSAYLLHHLPQNQQEKALRLLYDRTRRPGVLIIRSCDDGQYLHHPWCRAASFVERTNELPGSSDRHHGRRLPAQMNRLQPTPDCIEVDLPTYHSGGMDREGRRRYWTVFHSTRVEYARELSDDSVRRRQFVRDVETMRERIVERPDVLDSKTVPLAVAFRGAQDRASL